MRREGIERNADRLSASVAPYASCLCPNAQDMELAGGALVWIYRLCVEPVVREYRKRRDAKGAARGDSESAGVGR